MARLRKISPNRIAVYLVALGSVTTALVPVFTDAGLEQVASLAIGLASVTAVAVKWLSGWQQFEGAMYQQQLIETQHVARLEQAQAASKPGGSGPRINLPR